MIKLVVSMSFPGAEKRRMSRASRRYVKGEGQGATREQSQPATQFAGEILQRRRDGKF